MKPPRSGSVTSAWRATLVAVVLNTTLSPIEIVIAHALPTVRLWPSIASSLVGVALLATMFALRNRRTDRAASAIFLINALATLIPAWTSTIDFAASNVSWIPFRMNKLGVLTVALLAPEPWAGVVGIGLYGLTALAQLAEMPKQLAARIAHGEGWVMVVFMLFASGVLSFRVRQQKLERDLARAHAESDAFARLAVTIAAVRDLSNTPLQVIRFSTAVLRAKSPELLSTVERIDHAVDRMSELNAILESYEADQHWTPDIESFDPKSVLSERARSSTTATPAKTGETHDSLDDEPSAHRA